MSVTQALKVAPRKSVAVNTGLEAEVREQLARHLSVALAKTYLLVVKSHLYHWNVVGPLFKSIHDLTEAHYEDLFQAADVIAERIRALGHRAPVDADDIKMDLTIGSPGRGMPDAKAMIEDLVKDHETLAAQMRDIAAYAGDNSDVVTEDMLTARIGFHEQAAWMLRAIVAE